MAATSRTQTCGSSWSTVELALSLTSSDCVTRRCVPRDNSSCGVCVTVLQRVYIFMTVLTMHIKTWKDEKNKIIYKAHLVGKYHWILFHLCSFFSLLISVNRGWDCHHLEVHTERSRISSLHEEDPSRHQGRKHPPQHWGTRQTRRLWSCWTTYGNISNMTVVVWRFLLFTKWTLSSNIHCFLS